MKRVLLIASGVAVALAVLFWPYTVGLFMMGKSLLADGLQVVSGIREEPGPWEVVDPGQPNAVFVKPYVLQAGAGEAVQIGDIEPVRKAILDPHAPTITKDMGPSGSGWDTADPKTVASLNASRWRTVVTSKAASSA